MGLRGPAPTPTAVLQARNSWRATANRREPVPELGIPECPAWLDPEAKQVWDQVVPRLEAMGVLSLIDGHALGRYCVLFARWIKAEQFIQRYGSSYPITDKHGRPKCFLPFPEVAIAAKLSQELGRLEAQFGLTPSSRSRITVLRGRQEVAASDSSFAALRGVPRRGIPLALQGAGRDLGRNGGGTA